jgi:arylsulfatase
LPEEGISLLPAFKGETISRGPLCWEHEGNRAIRLGDWKLIAAHRENWQLYNLATDRTELDDLASKNLEKVAELRTLYEQWAKRCGVVPWPVRTR